MADLKGIPLIYGANDAAVSGNLRKTLEAQEKKRAKNQTEYALVTDANGNVIGTERHGGKGSVTLQGSQITYGKVFTHNHPRSGKETGYLGGTFSDTDLRVFSKTNFTTMRASAAEGTYSMTKTANFNKSGFDSYVRSITKQRQSEYTSSVNKLMAQNNGSMSYGQYRAAKTKAFNAWMVSFHNDLLAGQTKYGYTYTLESN
jgi:hypothetical protein